MFGYRSLSVGNLERGTILEYIETLERLLRALGRFLLASSLQFVTSVAVQCCQDGQSEMPAEHQKGQLSIRERLR